MGKKIESVKKNKNVYIACGTGIVVGVVAGIAVTKLSSNLGNQVVQKIVQIGWRNETNPVIVNLVERSTPSKPVHLVGTDLYFSSLSDAARKTGHALSTLSKHINGVIPDVKGDVFELLQPAD